MDSVVRTNPSGRPIRIPFDANVIRGSVFQAFLDARGEFGGGTPALVDGDGRVLSYDELVRASFALGHALKQVIDTNDMIASALIRYNKPHPQAYLYIINLHGFDPSECVFIDDQLENVVAARKLGMIGLHVKDKNYKEIRRQLEALGVL